MCCIDGIVHELAVAGAQRRLVETKAYSKTAEDFRVGQCLT
jgi:hypothetical protein